MPDEVTPERVAAIAAAARVPLEQTSAARPWIPRWVYAMQSV